MKFSMTGQEKGDLLIQAPRISLILKCDLSLKISNCGFILYKNQGVAIIPVVL
jgi:hypothetical protein